MTISAQELHALIQSGKPVVAVDARWTREKSAFQHYSEAHIPLAMFCNPEVDLAGVPSRESGRNPLPDVAQVRRAMFRWGVTDNHDLVIYDQGDGLLASRAWWILKWAGMTRIQVLRGGFDAWLAAGYDTAGGPGNLPQPGTIRVTPGHMPVVDIQDVLDWPDHGVLVDARNVERFNGISEKVDLQAGHIPGAVNLPARSLQSEDHGFLPAEEIRAKLAEIGVTDGAQVAVYSGSGLHSSLFIQAMHSAGLEGASLFTGGWSQWAGNPSLPIVRA